MTPLTITHVIHCTAERFWQLYFDPDFTRELIIGGLGFHECRLGDIEESETELRREMTAVPRLELPQAVVKVLGPRFSYGERGTFDKKKQVWRWDTVLGVLPERIKLGGSLRVEPHETDRCRRIADLWVDVRMFGVGGLIEKAAERSVRKGWDDSARWLNRWLDRGGRG